MKKTITKICGLMREEDIESCILCKVDIIGFVVEYPVAVPWNLSVDRAKELIAYFKECKAKYNSSSECCVVTGGSSEKLIGLLEELPIDYIQLHYKEDVKEIQSCVDYRNRTGKAFKIIKTIPKKDPLDCVKAYENAGADILLLDARTPENAAEKSTMFDEGLFTAIKDSTKLPVMAAGGIVPENVGKILSDLKPDMIDIMTGVEEDYGIKSKEKIEMIMKEVAL